MTSSRDTEPEDGGRADLDELDDDELRAEARRRGLAIGRTLSKARLLELLRGGVDEEDPELNEPVESVLEVPRVFKTKSMAKVFAGQGLDEEASRLYRHLEDLGVPGDGRKGRQRSPRDGDRRRPLTAMLPSLPERYGGSWILVLPCSASSLYCCWELDRAFDARVAKLAGDDARRMLRVVSTWRGDRGILLSARDESVDGLVGERFLRGCRPGALHTVALGWVLPDGSFLSLCHERDSVLTPEDRASSRTRHLRTIVAPGKREGVSTTRSTELRRPRDRSLPPLPWDDGVDERGTTPSGGGELSAPSSWSFSARTSGRARPGGS